MKLELFEKISFHDSKIKAYKKNENDITFLIEDGWIPDTYFKITLKNIKVEVMRNNISIIRATLYHFNAIFKKDANYHIDGREIGIDEESNKYYLKIYIDWPKPMMATTKEERNTFEFDGIKVDFCDDYNDTGDVYIKFIMDDFEVEEF